ncbi:MAG TPA: DUF1697 domain-containing protein [Longimicrobiales bacterium]|nr:DUF1697 domain-containing protein [Longimicrobiales bacterium]
MAQTPPVRRFALLRGINVGGRTVRSPALCAVFEAMGFGGVATFLASGNVVFEPDAGDAAPGEAAALEARIEARLREALGYEPATFLRSCAELADAGSPERLDGSPLAGEEGVTVNVVFLKGPAPGDFRDAVLALRSDVDDFLFHGRELYWLRRGKMSESPAWVPLEKALAGRGTTRNLNTVRRMLAKFCGDEPR